LRKLEILTKKGRGKRGVNRPRKIKLFPGIWAKGGLYTVITGNSELMRVTVEFEVSEITLWNYYRRGAFSLLI
jgi:hypothetical protein